MSMGYCPSEASAPALWEMTDIWWLGFSIRECLLHSLLLKEVWTKYNTTTDARASIAQLENKRGSCHTFILTTPKGVYWKITKADIRTDKIFDLCLVYSGRFPFSLLLVPEINIKWFITFTTITRVDAFSDIAGLSLCIIAVKVQKTITRTWH